MKYTLEVESQSPKSSFEKYIELYIPDAEYFHDKTITSITDKNNSSSSLLNILNPNPSQSQSQSGSTSQSLSLSLSQSQSQSQSPSPSPSPRKNNLNVSYQWKLPIHSASSFASLFNHLESLKDKNIIHDFCINAPLLEELFIQLDRENNINYNKTPIKVQDVNSIKRPGVLSVSLRLARYRIKLYLRNKIYILMTIFLPFIVSVFVFYYFNSNIKYDSNKDKVLIKLSSDMFKNQKWNFDMQYSSLSDMPLEVLEQQFPKLANGQSSIDYYNEEEIFERALTQDNRPYFVSSISGEYIKNDSPLELSYYFKILYNNSMMHSLPVTINAISNAILASYHTNKTIHTRFDPFYNDSLNLNEDSIRVLRYAVIIAILISIGLTLSFYGINIIHEKNAKLLKQLQLNGISNLSYWLSILFSDYFVFMLTLLVILIAVGLTHFIPFFNIVIVGLFLVFTGLNSFSCLLFQYVWSFLFKRESKAYIFFAIINIFTSTIFLFINKYMGMDQESNSNWANEIDVVEEILFSSILPNFSFIYLINNLINIGLKRVIIEYEFSIESIFLKSRMFVTLFSVTVNTILYGMILIRLVYKRNKIKRKRIYKVTPTIRDNFMKELREGDDDVLREYERVQADKESNEIPIKLVELTKEYEKFNFETGIEMRDAIRRKDGRYNETHISKYGTQRVVLSALNNVTFGVDQCECFGILGPNGSGKSTLLNTLSLIFPQSLGTIYYDGKDTLSRKGNEILIGYCPQEDTLWEFLTLSEHVEMFLHLRGYSRSEARALAKKYIDYCNLNQHRHKYPFELSGGTRRKLNILIALCCFTTKIILDEPTAGMDPSTRHYVWNMIKSTIQNTRSSIIMSTHSMEEAELLCNRIGIIVDGRLRCIGTPEHLKMKFGNTYLLEVHSQDLRKFHRDIVKTQVLFGECSYKCEEKSPQRLQYEINHATTQDIGRVFDIMEHFRSTKIFSDYSLTKTSLEQVFINFAHLKDID
eukprot:jgi/Orpsp1_1/1180743/evm.model.c7180000074515.1